MKRHKDTENFKASKKQHTSPLKPTTSQQAGVVHPSSSFSPKRTPNIGRSRAPSHLSSRLQQTPPRASYADKFKGIFSQAASRSPPRPLFPNIVRQDNVLSPDQDDIAPSTVNSDDSGSSSTLTSESELEKKLHTGHAFWKDEQIVRPVSSMNIRAAIWNQQPHQGLAAPTQSSIPQIQEPSPPKSTTPVADASSDEWTGDEEFLPKTARQQARLLQMQKNRERLEQERKEREARLVQGLPKTNEANFFCGSAPSPDVLCKAAQNSREVRLLLQTSPLRKTLGPDWDPKTGVSPSRFMSPRPFMNLSRKLNHSLVRRMYDELMSLLQRRGREGRESQRPTKRATRTTKKTVTRIDR